MTTLNQFFPSGGGAGGGGEPTLIPAEIVVVGGGAWGFYCLRSGCKCFAVPGPAPYSFTYCIAGYGGAAIHAQNFMLKRGSTCSIEVGVASTDATPCNFTCLTPHQFAQKI